MQAPLVKPNSTKTISKRLNWTFENSSGDRKRGRIRSRAFFTHTEILIAMWLCVCEWRGFGARQPIQTLPGPMSLTTHNIQRLDVLEVYWDNQWSKTVLALSVQIVANIRLAVYNSTGYLIRYISHMWLDDTILNRTVVVTYLHVPTMMASVQSKQKTRSFCCSKLCNNPRHETCLLGQTPDTLHTHTLDTHTSNT